MQGLASRREGRFTPSLVPLLLVGLPLAYASCTFPSSWTGQWYQNSKESNVTISGSTLGDRTCIDKRNDMYIVYDNAEKCYRCLVINDRHENVIQFREVGMCKTEGDSFDALCYVVRSDEILYSMFRLDSKPIACPFNGPPFTFSYNRGDSKECLNPVSHAESCTDESKLLLKYQACPDVEGTESNTEELQCLATWKDGRMKYLVGTLKVFGRGALGYEKSYRCFVYDVKHHEGRITYQLADSGDPTCNGLNSVSEGSRALKFTKVPADVAVDREHSRCKYPSWVTQHHDWHSLDGSRSYHFTSGNATLKVTLQDNTGDVPYEEKIVCHNLENDNVQGHRVKLVAHFTSGCDSGYVCMIFHRRDGHVIELQQSNQKAIMPDEACTLSDPSLMPYTTLITSTLHQRKCPQPGRYSILDFEQSRVLSTMSRRHRRGVKMTRPVERTAWQEESDEEDCRNTDIQIGCSTPGQNEMIIANTCEREEVAYSCHGSWEEKGTWYTIVSQRSTELTVGLGQTFCFSMRMADAMEKLSARGTRLQQREQELWLTRPARTCQRETADQWTYRLASQGVCEDLTKAASSAASSSSLSRVSLVLSAGAALLCILLSR
ncbi:uncharacterized protein LOC105694504 [Orussus abietinus]|uniref:uncharacterized protein LOC105694504 n=1 Tax=Orussus abietinus TaxID=222816 RepID=UPI000625DFAD|nr:uncharacterized protein LOC105694504 [Orussus abietinus]